MKRLFEFAKKTLPKISRTEQIALESGTVGVEQKVFQGIMNSETLRKYRLSKPTKIDKEMFSKLPNIVKTVNESSILMSRLTSKSHPFWNQAKKDGFFSLIVPEEYGGKKMSPSGLSILLQKLSSVSASLPVHVMVPNSLGPAELIALYGTNEQKEYHLPKLAQGSIPCFGLTSLHAGSDAAGSMTDTGSVVKRGGKIKLILNCEKRYITLAPVADVVGLAFKIVDPENILEEVVGKNVDGEITLAIVERDRKNLELGSYTDPLGVGFANGTVVAKNMEIEINDIIGGVNGIGQGWKFLMEALAAGRGTALPAGAAGSSKMLTNAVSGYSVLRKQFKVPIHSFEGIQEKLADMAIKTYEIDSLVNLMNCILEKKEKPPIMSAILKQRTTELSRDVINHAMDIVAGSAICMGPQNFVAPAYFSCPIGITVEGSNTMTRSLLIFGQGLIRSHPHMLPIIHSIQNNDYHKFSDHVFKMVYENTRLVLTPVLFSNDLERFVKFFSLSSTLSLVLGGQLKRKEFLSGRYADLLSYIITGYAMEWHASKNNLSNHVILKAAQSYNLKRINDCVLELIQNHPHTWFHYLCYKRFIGNRTFSGVSDHEKSEISNHLGEYNSVLRKLFDTNTLSHMHPNIKRINDALSGKNINVDDIMKVDLYTAVEDKLVLKKD